jgi:hypothetical protein
MTVGGVMNYDSTHHNTDYAITRLRDYDTSFTKYTGWLFDSLNISRPSQPVDAERRAMVGRSAMAMTRSTE